MSCRTPFLKICLASFVGMFSMASPVQAVITLGGDPSIVGGTAASIDNVDAFVPVDVANMQEQFDIVLRNMQHLEIIDDGDFDLVVHLDVENTSATTDAFLFIDMFFSDENGDPIGPAIPSMNNVQVDAGQTFSNIFQTITLPGPVDFIFHDFHIAIGAEATDSVLVNAIGPVELLRISPDSSVGVWTAEGGVPEPVTAMLGLIGLATLGMATRRRVA